MPKEQQDFWPEDAEEARVRAGTDWRPDDDTTRSEGEPTYRICGVSMTISCLAA